MEKGERWIGYRSGGFTLSRAFELQDLTNEASLSAEVTSSCFSLGAELLFLDGYPSIHSS
jgi:hypothetical protein